MCGRHRVAADGRSSERGQRGAATAGLRAEARAAHVQTAAMPTSKRLLMLLVYGLLAASVFAGCGGEEEQHAQAPAKPIVLSLDFIPNAVHAPIYGAKVDGHDRAHGVDLEIRKPSGGPDALKLVASGKVDVGVLDIHDLAISREQGTDLVAIGALVDKPLAALSPAPESSARANWRERRSASPVCHRILRS